MPSNARRQELKFQDYIIESYKRCGGYARKWATDMQVGLPDLCATLPEYGGHWSEVKHRPLWGMGVSYKNPLDKMQVRNARLYIQGGALVYGAVIISSVNVTGSKLCVFHPLADCITADTSNTFDYVPGRGYPIPKILHAATVAPPF